MRGTRLLVKMATLCAIVLLLPGAAGAKARNVVTGPSQAMEFRLHGSHGYAISVFASGRQVSLTAEHGGSSASYTASGVVSPEKVEARLGNLGQISLQFHAKGRPKMVAPDRGCSGKKGTVESGTWVGTVDFKGEQGFTSVHATRGRAEFSKTPRWTCKGEEEEGSLAGIRWTSLEASANRGAFVLASRIESQAHPSIDTSFFVAAIGERLGGRLSAVRSISADAPIDAFALTEEAGSVTSATVSPPAPFTGTATFQRTAGSKGSWSGSLVGDFPGRSNVALAGPKFSAKIAELGG